MNILLLSVGTRNKIVQYFKQTNCGDGLVIATDMSPFAPALYEADKYYLVPRITDPGYIQQILDICQKERISGVLSLIDPELSLLAKHAADFAAIGVTVLGSSYDLCERSLDKYEMYRWLREHGYPCAVSFVREDDFLKALHNKELTFPVFVKPRYGSASISISKAEDMESVHFLFGRDKDMMIQQFLHGQEIGADVYIDMISGEVVSIFTKKKLVMRAGETDKSVSFIDERLFQFIKKFVKQAGYRGQIDIDIFENSGKYYISEVNPRFGGGYPHAYECGCDHMIKIVNNLSGIVNQPDIGNYKENMVMMKYNELIVKNMG